MKTICLDFDGVCNLYDGWKGEEELFAPRPHLNDFISSLKQEGVRVVIHSTRPASRIKEWLEKWEIKGVDDVVDHKPPATAYLDDRAVRFDGEFSEQLAKEVAGLKTFWEK